MSAATHPDADAAVVEDYLNRWVMEGHARAINALSRLHATAARSEQMADEVERRAKENARLQEGAQELARIALTTLQLVARKPSPDV